MSTQPLEQAIKSTRAVLAGVQPDQLTASTPCASWTVAQVIDHVVGGQHFFSAAVNGEPLDATPQEFAGGDFLSAFDSASAATLAAFGADGAMERIVHLPFGDMPGAAFVGIAATDTFTHGWDLARATGQATDLQPELAEALLVGAKGAIQDSFRGEEGKAPFGAQQEAPASASSADRLAAFLGRTV
jgi:uncharacterized protein (TIGR03086 family)